MTTTNSTTLSLSVAPAVGLAVGLAVGFVAASSAGASAQSQAPTAQTRITPVPIVESPAPAAQAPAAGQGPTAQAPKPDAGATGQTPPAQAAPAPAPAGTPPPAVSPSPAPAASAPAQPPSSAAPAPSMPTPTSPSEMAPGATQPPAAAEAPKPGAVGVPETVMLPDRPVLSRTGTATWEEAEKELGRSFEQIYGAIREAGLKQAGPPMVEYTESDDETFGFKAMVPLAEEAGENLPEDIERGRSPTGAALKFVHRGSFDGLEAVYNKIFDYLATKNLQVLRVIEEYPSDPATTPADKMVTNIYVFTEQP